MDQGRVGHYRGRAVSRLVQRHPVLASAKHFAVNNQEGQGYKPENTPIGASSMG